jgi:endonuclease/exonuclease/phosphatase family metal-dependent hydrolase
MAPTWRDALLFFSQLGPRLLFARFQAKARQHLTVVTAYAPTDAGEDVAKDAFYLMLFACLKGAPANDKLIVLGDFNAELGNAWQEQGGVSGKFHLHRGAAEPSDNGARLLDLAASFHLRAANTFFKHHRVHLATWQHAGTKCWYVKDYILVSGSAMWGVSDCHVFYSVHHGPSDHCLLGVSLQLHLRALKRDAPTRWGMWEGGALRDPGRCAAFG